MMKSASTISMATMTRLAVSEGAAKYTAPSNAYRISRYIEAPPMARAERVTTA